MSAAPGLHSRSERPHENREILDERTSAMNSRQRRSTPKGAAARSLEHVKNSLTDLERIIDPNEADKFIDRFNDFLRAARTVPVFLGKEPRGPLKRVYNPQQRGILFMQSWMLGYLGQLPAQDRDRYDYLLNLRDISTHDLSVRPDSGHISVQTFDHMSDLDNGNPHGNLKYQHDSGLPSAENLIQSTKISIRYFFADRPQEDIVTLCKEFVKTLETFVAAAYSANP